jgi:hypothetical protein
MEINCRKRQYIVIRPHVLIFNAHIWLDVYVVILILTMLFVGIIAQIDLAMLMSSLGMGLPKFQYSCLLHFIVCAR